MLDFHRQLLDDPVRTGLYRDALRALVTPSDVVLDLGCGTGILSLFAADTGARRVFAVDQGHIADSAAQLVRQLRYAGRVEVIHGRSTEIELPEHATVMITEILGATGFDEGIVHCTIDARQRLLAEGARIIPSHVVLWLVPADLPELYAGHVDSWSLPKYGYDFSSLRSFASNGWFTANIPGGAFLAAPAQAIGVDLSTVSSEHLEGTAMFSAARSGTVHGFVGWFDALLAPGLTLCTREPFATVWEQAFFPLERPVEVAAGTTIRVEMQTRDGGPWRWRGEIGTAQFDQTTLLRSPPCIATGRTKSS